MRARIKLVDGMMFVGESGSGHAVVMDGAPEYGGRNLGIRPMEMLLIGLGGCTGFDVVQILRKGREQVTDCEVEVTAERADTDPKVFTTIHIDPRVRGRNLAPAKVSGRSNCPRRSTARHRSCSGPLPRSPIAGRPSTKTDGLRLPPDLLEGRADAQAPGPENNLSP
jgi:putative redox protein